MADPQALALNKRIVACHRCPRLRRYGAKVAREKRASYRDWDYWGRPVPNFGAAFEQEDTSNLADIRLIVVGLAPAAHGGNRTGRMFTGDRSGDFLYRAMHEAGYANQPTSVRRGDGLELRGAIVTAAAHCAPPANKPRPQELRNCQHWLDQTFDLCPRARVVVCLGGIAFVQVLRLYQHRDWIDRPGRYKFGHGVRHLFESDGEAAAAPGPVTPPAIVCSYHPSQQNTFTGRLTAKMLREVFETARRMIGD